MDSGHDCDGLLRSQLVFQRGASTAKRMNEVRAQIQSQRQECAAEVWNPKVDDTTYSGGEAFCFATAEAAEGDTASVGTQVVPAGLRDKNTITGVVRSASGRDADNDIIVYWGDAANRPTDNATCWLYVKRLATWSENY